MSVLVAALAVDLLFGEPPARVHPVVWMGRLQTAFRRQAPSAPGPAFLWGVLMAVAGPLMFGGLTWLILRHTSGVLHWLLAVYLLKSAFAVRGLAAAALRTRHCLSQHDAVGARGALASLVSRDTATLTPSLISSAAIESMAENCCDSIVAPLLVYVVGGVPAAVAYRAINTLDAMIGYRGDLEWLGKAAARLDDLVNLVPARLTAVLLAAAAPLARGSVARALVTWAHDRARTESPNAGHPMAAMAGALGVVLEKRGVYRLGGDLRVPGADDIARAVRVMAGAAALMTVLALVASVSRS